MLREFKIILFQGCNLTQQLFLFSFSNVKNISINIIMCIKSFIIRVLKRLSIFELIYLLEIIFYKLVYNLQVLQPIKLKILINMISLAY
jgi:hypothetical protein